jgi:superfamily I DNA/RNA helicase
MSREDFISCVCQTLKIGKQTTSCLDYGDMIWMPYVFGCKFEKYDRVFIDEAGDLNAAQLFIALNSCKPDGRILAVGDNFQVLYSFTGVEEDVLSTLTKRLKAKVLPLPISYRCPRSVIKLAQEIVPDIQAAPNAKEGSVKTISEDIFLSLVKPGDFILSRVNAPLIYYCMELVRNGVRANIAGRDIGKSLAWLVRKSETKTVDEFLIWLAKWKDEEVARLEKKGRDPILILDKASCLENLCKGSKDTQDILDKINELFSDAEDKDIVSLSSIHRAKGKECDRVFVIASTLKRGMNRSEDNICYVSFTRAKSELFLVK